MTLDVTTCAATALHTLQMYRFHMCLSAGYNNNIIIIRYCRPKWTPTPKIGGYADMDEEGKYNTSVITVITMVKICMGT